jgi:CMP-N,N'-diacetyllegionaminic acid synthase
VYNDYKVLCIIPARSGSKGIPGKNIKLLCGKPLIAYSIEQALKTDFIDRIVVSTDDENIAEISRNFGAETPFIRPANLATDEASTLDVLLHSIEWCKKNENLHYDIVLLLHANTPLRDKNDIRKCVEILVDQNADNVFSVSPASNNPYFNMVEVNEKNNEVALIKDGNFHNRQSAPSVYDMNSSIYTWWNDILVEKKALYLPKTRIHIMPRERSVDIDEPIDFRIAEMLMKDCIK